MYRILPKVACLAVIAGLIATARASADENAQEALASLASQMRGIESARAKYRVRRTSGSTGLTYDIDVSYVGKGDQFNVREEWVVPHIDGINIEQRAYNGHNIKILDQTQALSTPQGRVDASADTQMYRLPDDLLALCGFSLSAIDFSQLPSNYAVSSCGTEVVSGHTCSRVLLTTPYSAESRAYYYYWIEETGGTPRLIKDCCLIDGAAERKLYERRYEYSGAGSLPTKVWYERYTYSDSPPFPLEYMKVVDVLEAETNVPVDDSECDFQFPDGTVVYDATTGASYKAGQDPLVDKSIGDLLLSEPVPSVPDANDGVSAPEPETVAVASAAAGGEKPLTAAPAYGWAHLFICGVVVFLVGSILTFLCIRAKIRKSLPLDH